MKNKRLNKLFSFANEKTSLRNCVTDSEREAVKKHYSRQLSNANISVKNWADNRIIEKLDRIAYNLPEDGYSMGSKITVYFAGLKGTHDTRQQYARSCSFKPTHGGYLLKLSVDDLRNIQVIGGLVTYIHPGQKSKVKKCYWHSNTGSKQHFVLTKVSGYVYGGYHSLLKSTALEKGTENIKRQKEAAKQKAISEKMYKKALNSLYTFEDSLKAGNCEAGTRAFAMRCKIDLSKKHRGSKLLKLAEEKSTSSISFVKRMITYNQQQDVRKKMQKL